MEDKLLKTTSKMMNLDMDWVQLIKEAKTMGYTPQDIRLLLGRLSKA